MAMPAAGVRRMTPERRERAEPASPARYWSLAVLALGLALSAY
jgi:hypothetical protein